MASVRTLKSLALVWAATLLLGVHPCLAASRSGAKLRCQAVLTEALYDVAQSIEALRAQRNVLLAENTPDLKPGEFVELGKEQNGNLVFRLADGSGEFTLPEAEQPALVRYQRQLDNGQLVVELTHAGLPWQSARRVLVPLSNVRALGVGTFENLMTHLEKLSALRFVFKKGESVRYRGEDGLLGTGRFDGLVRARAQARVATDDGRSIVVPRAAVFKAAPGSEHPYSPDYHTYVLPMRLGVPGQALRAFLDGAARIESHPGFAALSQREKLFVLVQYVQTLVPWSSAGMNLETNARTFDEVVCAGAGVCRHLGILLGLVLNEAGIRHSVVMVHPQSLDAAGNSKPGHLWTEVQFADDDGQTKGFVLDPSQMDLQLDDVQTLSELAAQKPWPEFVKDYHLNPARTFSAPKPRSASGL
jgi:hypothetical protein